MKQQELNDLYKLDRRTIFDLLFRLVDWGFCTAESIEIYPHNCESGVWISVKLTHRSGRVFMVEGQRVDIVRHRLISLFEEIKNETGNPNLPQMKNPPPPPIKPKAPLKEF